MTFELKLQQERNLVPKPFNGEDKRRGGAAAEETRNTRKDPVGTASVQPQLREGFRKYLSLKSSNS
jgi:hypothetical protein